MPHDLSFFHEDKLGNKTLAEFYKTLPSEYLKKMFRRAAQVSCLIYYELGLKYLQAYRGPYPVQACSDSGYLGPSNGLQEVKFKWGYSDVPSTLAFFRDHYWLTLFFDSSTGECLSDNVDRAAEKLNDKGNKLFQEGKYTEAANYYRNAYLSCSSEYENKQTFKNNNEKAISEEEARILNIEGNQLFSQNKFSEAQVKYLEANIKSHVKKDEYYSNSRKASEESKAMNLNSQGDQLFEEGKYKEAKKMYKEAYNTSRNRDVSSRYIANIHKAQSELDAENLNSEGNHLFELGKYTEARVKYLEAIEKSQVRNQKEKYEVNTKKTVMETLAMSLNSQGDDLFERGSFSEAGTLYEDAYNKSCVSKEKSKYEANRKKALIALRYCGID